MSTQAISPVLPRTRWEYLLLHWSQEADGNSVTGSHFYVLRGRGQPATETHIDDFTTFLNDLGADGWELVSESMRNTASFDTINGFRNAVGPVSIFWTFKRVIA